MLIRQYAVFSLFVLVGLTAKASAPFRLLTTESSANPTARVVLGLQELGVNVGPVFIDTNPLIDAGLTPNLGAKVVFANSEMVSFSVGARYLQFIGGEYIENKVKASEPTIDRFRLDFRGVMAFAGATLKSDSANFHLNFQWAEIAGSRAVSPMFASDIPFSENWGGLLEAGYDLANLQPRASLGIYRSGPVFGLRLGATYIKIDDPFLKYTGVAPVLDLYWLVGGG